MMHATWSDSLDLSSLLSILWSSVIASAKCSGIGNPSCLGPDLGLRYALCVFARLQMSQFGSLGKCVKMLC